MASFGLRNTSSCHIPDLPKSNFYSTHSTVDTRIGIINCGGSNGLEADNRCFKLASNEGWTPFTSMIERRKKFAMAEGNDKLFAVGGGGNAENSMEWIDLSNTTNWTKVDLPFSVWGHCMTYFNSTHVLLIGGRLDNRVNKSIKLKVFEAISF